MKSEKKRTNIQSPRVRRMTLPLLRGMFICPAFIKKWNPERPVGSAGDSRFEQLYRGLSGWDV
jgi:hypothetical protein